jgi:hypothetical protein
MRFSLKWFLGLVAFTALVTAAAVWPFGPFRGLLIATVLASVLAAAVAARVAEQSRRIFAFGYVLFAVSYALLLSSDPPRTQLTTCLYEVPSLINDYVAAPLHRSLGQIHVRQAAAYDYPDQQVAIQQINEEAYSIAGQPPTTIMNWFSQTRSTVQSAAVALFGLLGGLLAIWLMPKNRGGQIAQSEPQSTNLAK